MDILNSCLFFDVDDTLYRRLDSFIKACKKTLPKDFELDYEELYLRRSYYSEYYLEEYHLNRITLEEMYDLRLNKSLDHYGYRVDHQTALEFEKQYRYFQDHVELSASYQKLLSKLKAKDIKMGIISNGVSEHQRKKLKSLGIERWIPKEHWVISGDLNIKKPDIRIFDYAAKLLEADNGNCLMVGDNKDSDILGANNANFKAIWLNHKNEEENGIEALAIVHNEDELIELLTKLYLL